MTMADMVLAKSEIAASFEVFVLWKSDWKEMKIVVDYAESAAVCTMAGRWPSMGLR